MSQILVLKHAGVELYQRPRSCNKWHLPVCSALRKDELGRLSPNNPNNWEEVDLDGCPTICYVMTGRLVKSLNRIKEFTSFFSIFEGCLGKGPAKEFFPSLWLKANNIAAAKRNKWEHMHGVRRETNRYVSESVRAAARRSIY